MKKNRLILLILLTLLFTSCNKTIEEPQTIEEQMASVEKIIRENVMNHFEIYATVEYNIITEYRTEPLIQMTLITENTGHWSSENKLSLFDSVVEYLENWNGADFVLYSIYDSDLEEKQFRANYVADIKYKEILEQPKEQEEKKEDKQEKDNKKTYVSKPSAVTLNAWIQLRYEYYDVSKNNGVYSGDKYTEEVFQDAADHYGLPVDTIWDIYNSFGM